MTQKSSTLLVGSNGNTIIFTKGDTFEEIVIPRSRSRLIESMARSCGISAPHWRRILSMSVVFPWSTWAITATLRRRLGSSELLGAPAAAVEAEAAEKARKEERENLDLRWRDWEEEKDLRVVFDQRDRSRGPAMSGFTKCEW